MPRMWGDFCVSLMLANEYRLTQLFSGNTWWRDYTCWAWQLSVIQCHFVGKNATSLLPSLYWTFFCSLQLVGYVNGTHRNVSLCIWGIELILTSWSFCHLIEMTENGDMWLAGTLLWCPFTCIFSPSVVWCFQKSYGHPILCFNGKIPVLGMHIFPSCQVLPRLINGQGWERLEEGATERFYEGNTYCYE